MALKANGDGLTALATALQQLAGKHEQLASHVADLADSHHRSQAELLHVLTSEKEVVRDRDGRASGVRIKRKEVMQ
jgi:small-conductance mechanosensitive channel